MNTWHRVPALALVAALTACSDSNTGTVTFSLSARRPPASLAAVSDGQPAMPAISSVGDSTVITMGNDTIILRSIELVVREVELKKVETAECDSVMENDDCEEFEAGPVLVALPLGAAAATTEISVDAPAGMYDKLEFEIH